MKKIFQKIACKYRSCEKSYLLFAFLLPFILTWLCYIAHGTYPFGNESVLVLDLNGQYVSFFEGFRDMVLHGGSLAYSWERALGGEMMGLYAYYLASPLSLIVCLLPKIHITEALLLIILTKAGLCGLTMGLFLHHSYPSKRTNIIAFSTMYAMSAYAVVQAHNTMWIDELVILPLLALGIDRLIRRKNYTLYTAALALALIVNFYIGFMMCIFTLFYFFYRYFSYTAEERGSDFEKAHFVRSMLRICILSIIALCIACVIILPAYYSLTFGKTTFSNPSFDFKQKFDLLDIFVKLYPGSFDTVHPEGLPFVYCGTLTLLMLPIFFITKNIRAREKVWGAAALMFFVFSFDISTVDLIWHGLQNPNWLNYRYSFMLTFFMIIFGYRAFCALRERLTDIRPVLYVGGVLLLLIMIIQKLDYDFLDDITGVWVPVICITAICAVLGIIFTHNARMSSAAGMLICIIVSIECVTAGIINIYDLDEDVVYTSRQNYVEYMDKMSPLINKITSSDDSFYRLEKSVHRKTNDPMAIGYRGVSNSTSTLNASVIKLLNRMGFASKSNWSKYSGGTPVADSLLGIKYILYGEEHDNNLYRFMESDEKNELYAYENPYVLPIAYASSDAIRTLDFSESENAFELMNEMVTAILGNEKTLQLFKNVRSTDIEYDNCEISYVTGHKKYYPENEDRDARMVFTIHGQGENNEMFMFMPTEYPRECTVRVNGEEKFKIMGNDTACIHSLGTFPKDEEILVSVTLNEEMCYIANGSSYFYYLDTALFSETIPKIAECGYTVTDYSDTMLSGTVTIGSGKTTLFTTIPYDEGWIVTIDGIKTDIIKTGDSLLAVPISEGTHNVRFEYRPIWITAGIALSCAGIILFIFTALLDTLVWKKRRKQKEEKIIFDITHD